MADLKIFARTIEPEAMAQIEQMAAGVLRKGAVSAKAGEKLTIPLNMRDGILVRIGKGNEDWNCSAPHGAGRLYSRKQARRKFSLEQYEASMAGIYTTCVNFDTMDEAPFAYKDMEEIISCIQSTVTIEGRLDEHTTKIVHDAVSLASSHELKKPD